MEKVHIIGKLKVLKKFYFDKEEVIRNIDTVGYLKDNVMFYPKKENSREYYPITKNKEEWQTGRILYTKLESIKEPKVEKPVTPKPPVTPPVTPPTDGDTENPKVLTKEELEKMTKAQIREYAKKTFGKKIDKALNKVKTIEETLKKEETEPKTDE